MLTELFWGPDAGPGRFLALYTQKPRTAGIKSHWHHLADHHGIATTAQHQSENNVWFSVCSRIGGLDQFHRGREAEINGMPAVWVDFDYTDGAAHASKNLPTREQVELAIMALPQPSAVIHSGYGYHCYWVFDQPWLFEPGDYREAAMLSRQFQEWLRQQVGFHVDDTADLPRMLRYPGTKNWKDHENPRQVLQMASGPKYPRTTVASWCSAVSVAVPAAPVTGPLQPSTTVLKPFDRHEVIAALSTNTNNANLAKRIVDGKPLATAGERNSTTNKASNMLAFLARKALGMDATVEDLFEILTPSYVAMATAADVSSENPPPTENEVRGQLARALHKAAEAALVEENENQRFIDALGAPKYTPEQIEAVAVEQGTDLETLKRRLIVAYQDKYYTLVNGQYGLKPWGKNELLVSLQQDLAPYGDLIQWRKALPNGGTAPKTAAEVFMEHGTTVNDIRASLVAEHSYIDDQTFVMATAPRRKWKAVDHPKIHDWIKSLGGPHYKAILNFMAYATMHDLPCAALYLSGQHGTGKSMLAAGLAKLWQSSAVSPFVSLGRFNYDLAARPLIFADEYDKVDRTTNMTGVMRLYISNDEHVIEKKYMPTVTLHGYLRFLICANNDNLFADHSDGNTRNDIEAIAARIYHVPVSDAASNYLDSIGRWRETEKWVAGGQIAEYATYLAEQAGRPKLEGRFLNQGVQSSYHTNMLAAGPVSSQVQEALLNGIMKPTKGIVVGDGHVLVNAKDVYEAWPSLSDQHTPSSIKAISSTIKKFSHAEQVRVKDARLWDVDWKILLTRAEEMGFNVDAIIARVNAPRKA